MLRFTRILCLVTFASLFLACSSSDAPKPPAPGAGGEAGHGAGGDGGSAGDPGSGGEGGGPGSGGTGGEEGGALCGNGVVDEGEDCDNGDFNSDTQANACRRDCRAPSCGDGVVDDLYGEDCDDGEANSDSAPNACRTNCRQPICGDGIVDSDFGEECDEGANNSDEPNASCRTDCKRARCGDGIIDSGELCDDGEWNSDLVSNACRTDCTLPFCGDGVVDEGERCDLGAANGSSEACRLDCTSCGDNVVDAEHGEACDNGHLNSDTDPNACRTNCQPPRCGDGVIDLGEECDGDKFGGASCVSLGFKGGNLACDPVACTLITSGCTHDAVCGDGIRESPAEQCDDRNQTPGDGCGANCQVEDGGACGKMEDLNALLVESGDNKYSYGPASTVGTGNHMQHAGGCKRNFQSGNDITFAYWAERKGKYTFTVRGAGDGSYFAIFARTNCSNAGSELACGDGMVPDIMIGMNSKVDLNVDAHTQLYITVETAVVPGQGENPPSPSQGSFYLDLTVVPELDGKGEGESCEPLQHGECATGLECSETGKCRRPCPPGSICI